MENNHEEGERIAPPNEVITEILSRLDARTIGKLRTRSKTFLSVTSSKKFIQDHLEIARKEIDNYAVFIMLFDFDRAPAESDSDDENYRYENHFSLRPFLHQPFSTLTIIRKDHFSEQRWRMIGSVNGIFCLHFNDPYITLWNPTTGGLKNSPSWNELVGRPIELPCDSPYWYERPFETRCDHPIYGFGFHEDKNDYLVLVLFRVNQSEFLVFIYTAMANSWWRISSFKGMNNFENERLLEPVAFAAGKFHWTMESFGNFYIVSLDPETELYGRVEIPQYERNIYVDDMIEFSLGSLGGCLSFCCFNQNSSWDVWILEDYGREETWKTVFHFVWPGLRFLSPMCMLPDGEMLLESHLGVVLCDMNNDSYRVVELPEDITRQFFNLEIYVKSLVSPCDLELPARDHGT